MRVEGKRTIEEDDYFPGIKQHGMSCFSCVWIVQEGRVDIFPIISHLRDA